MLTLANIIKFVMSSASEAELGENFITAQEMVAMRQTLEEIKWPQPKSPIHTDNSAAASVFNNIIVPRKLNTMDRRLHWIRFREAQGQFCYHLASRNLNWWDYSTKHYPLPLYHNSKRIQCSGNSKIIKKIKSH